MLRADSISRSYHSSLVLEDFSLDVAQGETTVLLGSSGAGKSTALRCLAGLEPVQSGTVTFKGKPFLAKNNRPAQASGAIGMVFQQFNLFPHLTVLENICLAPRRVRGQDKAAVEKRATDLLEKVGLAAKAGAYPFQLSGGQQQRVAIARALAMAPELVLFDEPTSALDPEYTREVLQVMRALTAEGLTSVIVTHEIAFARETADRIVYMDAGRIVEQGPAQDIFGSSHERTRRFLDQALAG
ncbi:amino acid ABC transporter ATP-binding protein [Kineosporia mesophila]|uniref:amino acid ABC transporter ATP-binding protein n=1 Tax=Kineosporia mesophila TaxID=566012 RepID=UPI001E444EE7|nr:amino acid ABC transporter ATP-binding protein [Kineosporia mesophila]MCD5355114.1 amino acid ABC transporter ATP-binding protein [Kineosporia mesophila]